VRVHDFRPTKQFTTQLSRLSPHQQARVKQALCQVLVDLSDPQLRAHRLKGQFAGTISISAGGDLRIHLRLVGGGGSTVAIVDAVGTHSQLYR